MLGKKIKFFGLIFILTVFLSGCQNPVPTLKQRLEKFEKILTTPILNEFKAQNYGQTIQLMTKEYQTNPDFRVKLDKVKDDEAINLFTIKEVVEFYRDYFVSHEKNK